MWLKNLKPSYGVCVCVCERMSAWVKILCKIFAYNRKSFYFAYFVIHHYAPATFDVVFQLVEKEEPTRNTYIITFHMLFDELWFRHLLLLSNAAFVAYSNSTKILLLFRVCGRQRQSIVSSQKKVSNFWISFFNMSTPVTLNWKYFYMTLIYLGRRIMYEKDFIGWIQVLNPYRQNTSSPYNFLVQKLWKK